MIIARRVQTASRIGTSLGLPAARLRILPKAIQSFGLSVENVQIGTLLNFGTSTFRIHRCFSSEPTKTPDSTKKDVFLNELELISKVVELSPLQKSVFLKLFEYSVAYDRLNEELSQVKPQSESGDSENSYDQSNSRTSGKNIDMLSMRNNQFQVVKEWVERAKDCASLLEDPNMKDLVEEEKASLAESLTEITDEAVLSLVEKDKYDDCRSCSLEFRPGVGGGESMIFAEEMYYAS